MLPVTSPLKIVTIGGGTGLSTLLTGFKPHLRTEQRITENLPAENSSNGVWPFSGAGLTLTAIVTVTDDGKSSGRLRSEFGVLPPGDIRNCLVALAPDDRFLKSLFKHRFAGQGSLGGHSLGNLILVALTQMSGNFLEAVENASSLLGCAARVLPSTLDLVDLEAQIGDQTAYGQRAIKALCSLKERPIRNLKIAPGYAKALPQAIDAILQADLITLGPGSLFTSVIPNLLISGIAHALSETKAKIIYICNLMTEADETYGLSAADHVREILKACPQLKLDSALFNSTSISAEMRELYAEEDATLLEPPSQSQSVDGKIKFFVKPLVSEARFVRHNPENLVRSIFEIYYNNS